MKDVDRETAGVTSAVLVYPGDRTHSPIDEVIVRQLKEIAARGEGRSAVFSKVGDSISTSLSGVGGGNFLNCFDGVREGEIPWEINVRLGQLSGLSPTIEFFKTTKLGLDDSWTRASLATKVGMTADWPLAGSPSPLERELAEASPRFAVVMFGSNDVRSKASLLDGVETYERNMRTLTDRLLAKGVVPLLTTMPPELEFMRLVPLYSGVVRAIAQGRQVPLIDYQRELLAIDPPHGLAADGVHPSCADYQTCCWFDAESLSTYGYNIRNLITLQALDRMRRIFELGEPSLEPLAVHQAGDGSSDAPFVIPSVPWGELRNSVAGRQTLYRLVLSKRTSLRILVLGGQVRLLPSEDERRLIATTLDAGSWLLSVEGAGEYNLSVTQCLPGDPDCT